MREYLDRGAAALGENIVLGCQCVNAALSPTVPDACPTMTIYDSTGTVVGAAKQIPVQDKFGRSGRFAYKQLLDSTFATGRYWVTYDYTTGSGGYTGSWLDTFEVLPGGDASGCFLSMLLFKRPFGRMLIGQTDAGKLFLARNPKV